MFTPLLSIVQYWWCALASGTCAVHRTVRWSVSTPALEYAACAPPPPIPASAFSQRRGSVAISFFQRRVSSGNSEMPLEWGSTESTYLQLQGCFGLWPVSMVSMFPIPSLSHVDDKGFSCCHYTSSPLIVRSWLGNEIWMPKYWHPEHLSMTEWLLSSKNQFIVATITWSKRGKGTSFVDLFKLLPTIHRLLLSSVKWGQKNPTW